MEEKARRFYVVGCMVASLLWSLPLAADSPCRTIKDEPVLSETEWVVYIQKGDHANVELASATRPATVSIEGTICAVADGSGLGHIPLTLIQYRPVDARHSGVPSLQDLQLGKAAGFEVVYRNEIETLPGGRFRATVPPGSFALQVPWNELPEVDLVVLDMRFLPGPELVSARERSH